MKRQNEAEEKQGEVSLPTTLELPSIRGLDDLMNRFCNFTETVVIAESVGWTTSIRIAKICLIFEHFFALSPGKKLRFLSQNNEVIFFAFSQPH
jgi:hypothetical protein